MKTITIDQLLTLNQTLLDHQVAYKIHLSDACGGQSFWLECLDEIQKDTLENAVPLIDAFFQENRISIQWDNNHKNFWTVK